MLNNYEDIPMKFVLFLIKTLSLILCASLLGAYLFYTFLAKDKSEFMANGALLLFVLSMVITSLTVMLTENKVKSNSNGNAGLDAYIADLRKEEKNTAKQIQSALPKDLVPMLEKFVASLGENKDGIERIVLDSKTAFSSALSENKNAITGILGDNQTAINNTLSENIRMLEARMADKQDTLMAKLENLLEQTSNLSAKTLPPLNLALENINTRLDDLENKIVSSRVNYADIANEPIQAPAVTENLSDAPNIDLSAETTAPSADFASAPELTADTPSYDFTDLSDAPNIDLSAETTAPSADFASVPELTADTPSYDFTNLSDAPSIDLSAELSVEDVMNTVAENSDNTNNYDKFSNELSDLADLEIMQEPVAPTAEPNFNEIDIDEFLKGRTDVKN